MMNFLLYSTGFNNKNLENLKKVKIMTLTRFIETTFFAEGKNIPLRFFNMLWRNKFSTRINLKQNEKRTPDPNAVVCKNVFKANFHSTLSLPPSSTNDKF